MNIPLNIADARATVYDAILDAVIATEYVDENAIAFPGSGFDPEELAKNNRLPRVEVNHVSAEEVLKTLKGQVYSEIGTIQVIFVSKKRVGVKFSMEAAESMSQLLRSGTTFLIPTGGKVSMSEQPDIQPGFPDDTSWRIPVVIRYLARGW